MISRIRKLYARGLCIAASLMVIFTAVSAFADPMHVAVRSLDLKMFNRLIKAQQDLTATDSAGMTALHHACALGVVEMVQALLENGALASQTCNLGNNALHYAVSMGALCLDPQPPASPLTICPLTVPAMLASAGVDVNLLNSKGEAPLHIAARNGLVGVIATLLQSGADPHIRTSAGETPLHLIGGSLAQIAAQVLILGGARLDAVANDGSKPIDRAVSRGNLLLINMLKQYETKESP
jgi:ankyrin repeat protein